MTGVPNNREKLRNKMRRLRAAGNILRVWKFSNAVRNTARLHNTETWQQLQKQQSTWGGWWKVVWKNRRKEVRRLSQKDPNFNAENYLLLFCIDLRERHGFVVPQEVTPNGGKCPSPQGSPGSCPAPLGAPCGRQHPGDTPTPSLCSCHLPGNPSGLWGSSAAGVLFVSACLLGSVSSNPFGRFALLMKFPPVRFFLVFRLCSWR